MKGVYHISSKHTIFLWIFRFLTLVLNLLLPTLHPSLQTPLNIPSGTHSWNGEFYSVAAKIYFLQRKKFGSILVWLLNMPWHSAFAQCWHLGWSQENHRNFVPWVLLLQNLSKSDFYRNTTDENIVSPSMAICCVILLQVGFSRKLTLRRRSTHRRGTREYPWDQAVWKEWNKKDMAEGGIGCGSN